MFKPFAKTIVLITLIFLASACEPTVPPTPGSTSTPETPIITPTITPMQALTSTTTPAPPVYLEQVAVLDLPDSFVNTIIFSPDSQTMITGDRNGEVLVWERDTWAKTIFLPARSTYAEDDAAGIWYWGTLLLSPDGDMIVHAYGDDGTVTGYDRTGQVMFTYSFGSRVWAVAISPDGRLLAAAGLPNNVVIFDLETYKQVANLVSDHEYIFNLVFSPDGNTIVVGYERPGNVIKLWDTATWQETSTFTHVSERIDYHDILFTPDGTQLILADHLLGDPIGVRIWDLASSQIVWEFRQNSEAAYQIALSPDGSLLASVHEALQMWDMETRAPVKTIRGPDRELGAVAFSPDGTLLAFSVWGEGVQIWKVTQDDTGGELQTAADQVTWLAFYSNRDGNPDIYLMNADGSEVARLTNDPAFDDSPALSPDGRQIAFLTARHDPNPQFPDLKYELYVMDIDGSNLCRLTTTETAEDHPAWSPDGNWISFDADYDGDGSYEIYQIQPDGSNLTRLTSGAYNDQFADWSPDGKQIAFASDRNGNWDLFVMDADGSNQQAITSSTNWELFPAWAPDGSRIAFNGLVPRSRNTDIFLVNADGSDPLQLTDSSGFDENPAWSPDGSQIVFQSQRSGNFELYVMYPDGSGQHPLAAHPANELWPSWAPSTPSLFEKSSQNFGLRETFQVGFGDLDGDGDLDAVFANPMLNNAAVWLNSGDGTFTDTGQPAGKGSFIMNISTLVTHHPVGFVLVLTIVWLALLLVFMGVATTILQKPYGDAMTASIGRLAVTTCVLFLAWRLDWLEASGISRSGSWQVWLLAMGGLVYFASASLYSFYGRIAFDFSGLLRLPDARAAVITHFMAGLSEEILFRGLVLFALIRVWGNTTQGILVSVLLAAALFALVHLTQVFTNGIPLSSALLLVFQVFVISIWWGALVVMGGSIWPAVILHFVVNAVVAVQGLTTPMVEPGILAYRQLLWFSLPLGVLAFGLLAKTALHPVAPEVP